MTSQAGLDALPAHRRASASFFRRPNNSLQLARLACGKLEGALPAKLP
jgi:hypothetical protein